jgi:DNA-binding winged helix-turn-helix (wHTH) protein
MPVTARRLHFAEFSLDPASGELTRNGRPVPLEYQPSIVLARLLSRSGEVVTRAELASALWGDDTHVNYDDGLNYCIRKIRAALGDDPRTPRFVETIPRRGYRFVAPVTHAAAPSWRSSPRLLSAVAAAALVVITVAMESRPNNHHEVAVSLVRALHDLLF